MAKIALIYTRLSDDKRSDELGVTRQLEDCRQIVQQRGWTLGHVLSDNDTSATGNAKRPGFDAALALIESGSVQVLVAWNLDRLTRNRRDTLRLMELGQQRGIVIALARGSDLDLSTPGGRLMAGILAEIARNEIEVKSDRQVRANRQRAVAGYPHFVSRPYGYTRQGEIVVDEAQVLHHVAEHFLSGWSTTEIASWLNATQIASATGSGWSQRVVKDHLLSKRNAGVRVYKGVAYPGRWTPIYSPELHERLVSEWTRRHGSGPRARADNRKYLLTGLLYCGSCGSTMAGGANHDHGGLPSRYKYRCVPGNRKEGCGNLMRVAETLDHLITESVLLRLDSPEARAALLQSETRAQEIAPLRARAETLRIKLDSLIADYAEDVLSRAEFIAARARVNGSLAEVERELASLYSSEQAHALLSPAISIREEWDRQTVGWQRTLLALVIERITVHRSFKRPTYMIGDRRFKFDPESVQIDWRA